MNGRYLVVLDILSLFNDTKFCFGKDKKIKYASLVAAIRDTIGSNTIVKLPELSEDDLDRLGDNYSGIAYVVIDVKYDARKFVSILQQCGLYVNKKLYKSEVAGFLSRKVDLTVDVLKNIDNFDTLVIATGDSDFRSLVEELSLRGKKTLLFAHASDKRALNIPASATIPIPADCIFSADYQDSEAS